MSRLLFNMSRKECTCHFYTFKYWQLPALILFAIWLHLLQFLGQNESIVVFNLFSLIWKLLTKFSSAYLVFFSCKVNVLLEEQFSCLILDSVLKSIYYINWDVDLVDYSIYIDVCFWTKSIHIYLKGHWTVKTKILPKNQYNVFVPFVYG